MIFLDAMIVNVAIPDIQREFSAGETGIQWVVAAYSLTMAMFMMSGGTFGDHFGRRLGYIGGIVLFCVASVGCGLAPGIPVLIVARGFQGVGAAVVECRVAGVGRRRVPRSEGEGPGDRHLDRHCRDRSRDRADARRRSHRRRRMAKHLPDQPDHRIARDHLHVALRYRIPRPASRSFDPPGQLLFIAGIGFLTYALIQGGHDGWRSPIIVGSFLIAAVVLVSFVRVELRSRDPMMDVHVFKDRVYDAAIYAVFATLFCVYGTLFIITQYFQNVRTYSPERSGVLILAMTIPTIILSPLTGRVVAQRGARTPTLIGLADGDDRHLPALGRQPQLSVAHVARVDVRRHRLRDVRRGCHE